MKILIAEDDLTSRAMLAGVLKKWGHEVVTTVNGAEAWQALQHPDAPRLVLLDWNMPELDGVEVCRRLRQVPTLDPPFVILLTGRSEKDDIVRGLDSGANDYILKPYDSQELRARIGVGQRMLELQASLLEARDALEHQAMHDGLTGILNRRAILERLEEELARAAREQRVLTVGMCDIDHFKRVNDTWGHQVGDEVLCGFSKRIREQLRPYDLLGRYGGEEFLVLAFGGAPGAPALFRRLQEQVAAHPFPTQGGALPVTVSIGVADSRLTQDPQKLVAAADQALYRAKAEGRNRVVGP
jgi:two-component system cell cycle response regulator